MGIGISLLLLAAGIILVAVTTFTAIGWILIAVAALGILLSLVFWSSWGGRVTERETVIHERR